MPLIIIVFSVFSFEARALTAPVISSATISIAAAIPILFMFFHSLMSGIYTEHHILHRMEHHENFMWNMLF